MQTAEYMLFLVMFVAFSCFGQALRPLGEMPEFEGGLTVCIGPDADSLPDRAPDNVRVHLLGETQAARDGWRRILEECQLTGRVSIKSFSGGRLPYGDNIVNRLIIGSGRQIPLSEVRRALAPGGYCRHGDGTIHRMDRPAEIDEWTHWLHDASGNAVSHDTRVGPPRRLQWIAAPRWSRSHNLVPSVTSQVIAGRRIFAIVDEAPANTDQTAPDQWWLVARDAFNGIELWRKRIENWGWKAWSESWKCRFTVPTQVPKRLAAVNESVYVTLGFGAPLTELDAATGALRRHYPDSEGADEVLVLEDRVVISRGVSGEPSEPRAENGKKSIVCYDRKSGDKVWERGGFSALHPKTGPMENISFLEVVAGGGAVFLVAGTELVSLSLSDGHVRWRISRPAVDEYKMRYNIRITDMCSLVYHGSVVLFAQLDPDRGIDWREIRGRLHAFDAETGKELWHCPTASWGWGHPADVFVVNGLVWTSGYEQSNRKVSKAGSSRSLLTSGQWGRNLESASYVGRDPRTGKVHSRASVFDAFDNGHHHRCYRNKATEKYLLTGYRGMELIPWAGGRTDLNHWTRGTCRLGPFPGNGLLYMNPHPCSCYVQVLLRGFVALAPESVETKPAKSEKLLTPGPAFEEDFADPELSSGDWPMFRSTPARNAFTGPGINGELGLAWEAQLERELTQAVTVADRCFVAEKETGRVVCLDAESGKPKWRYTAEGRIDSPPAFHRGRLFVGTRDGWVYCLNASSGRLAWRFLAAPEHRIVGAFDDLESAWPVHGAVLPADGKVYAAAGRSSYLDGGIHAYVLSARTGEVLAHKTLNSPQSPVVGTGHGLYDEEDGILADVMVGYGTGLYMGQRKVFELEDSLSDTPNQGPLHATAGMLDPSWFARTAWYYGDQPYGDYLVSDTRRVYGAYDYAATSANGGFFRAGSGYTIAAMPVSNRRLTRKRGKGHPFPDSTWKTRVKIRVRGMALAGETLLAVGLPDRLDDADAWASYQGRAGGRLLVLDTSTGKERQEVSLDAAPSYDGLSAGQGRVFVATEQGRFYCFAGDL